MFREMRRKPQALSQEEMINLLTNETRGVLSVLGDDGYPYGMPLNHYYDQETNHLVFHGAKIGHRIDAIKRNPKVSYCVFGQEFQKEGDWAKYVKSVIIFGKAEIVENKEDIIHWTHKIASKFPCPDDYVDSLLEKGSIPMCITIKIESMTGKLVHEA